VDFQNAYELSREIEAAHRPPLIVAGFRRMRPFDLESWAIDVLNQSTSEIATLDEKDDWEVRISSLLKTSTPGPTT
jgi:hypothetical protein